MPATSHIQLWKQNSILFCKYVDKTDIDLEIAKQCVQSRIEFSLGVSHPTLIDLKGVRSVSKAAREYFSKEGVQLITAGAFLTGSPLTKMLGNIFLKINKPSIPTRLFTDEGAANEWLKTYL